MTVTSTLVGGSVVPGQSHASHITGVPFGNVLQGTVTLTEERNRGSRNKKVRLRSQRDLT